jgi:hypothetical protein
MKKRLCSGGRTHTFVSRFADQILSKKKFHQYVERDLSAAPVPPRIWSMWMSYAFASPALIGPAA